MRIQAPGFADPEMRVRVPPPPWLLFYLFLFFLINHDLFPLGRNAQQNAYYVL